MRSSGTRVTRHLPSLANVGGQALIGGVMMRNGNLIGKSVRLPDGSICTEVIEYNGSTSKIPVWRGFLNICRMVGVGAAAMRWSANKQLVTGREPTPAPKLFLLIGQILTTPLRLVGWGGVLERRAAKRKLKAGAGLSKGAMLFSMVAGVIIALGIFLALPLYLGHLTGAPNLAEGLIRFGLVAGYLFAMSVLPGIGEVFQNHAAEHRAVWAYEKRLPLTVANVRKQSSLHPRCGSGLVLALVLISGLLFPLLAGLPLYVAIPARLILVPVVAGLGVELIKALALIRYTTIGRILLTPFLATQLLTTRTPKDSQIECAIAALNAVLPVEQKVLVGAGR